MGQQITLIMDITKAIDLLEKAQTVGIMIPPAPSIDAAASAEVFARTLASRGKTVGLLAPVSSPSLDPDVFRFIASGSLMPREFIISVDTSSVPLSELRYEKRDSGVDIILSPKSSFFKEGFVSFREGKIRCDAVCAIDIPNVESVRLVRGVDPAFFTETPIIALGHNAQHEHGEANLIDPEKSSSAEIIYRFLLEFPECVFDTEEANLLLAGILEQTDGFRSEKAGAETLLVSSELMRCGGTIPDARALARASYPMPLLQLLGRASVRSKIDEQGVLWSFLTTDDFEKTERTTHDIPFVMDWIRKEFPPSRMHALLWQNPHDAQISAMLSGEHEYLEKVREKRGGSYQSPDLLLDGSYRSFKDAEDDIRALLGEIL